MEDQMTKSLSALLLEAMRMKNISVEKLSQTTGISDRFINLLLEERFDKLPAAPYVRGYLLKIGETININGEEMWEIVKNYHRNVIAESGIKDKPPKNKFEIKKLNIKAIGITAGICILVLLVILRLPAFFGKPSFTISDLEDNANMTTSSVTVHGTMNPSDELTINNEPVIPNEKGEYEKKLDLEPGPNTFQFKVKGLLGKEVSITRQVYLATSTKKHEGEQNKVESTTTPTSTEN